MDYPTHLVISKPLHVDCAGIWKWMSITWEVEKCTLCPGTWLAATRLFVTNELKRSKSVRSFKHEIIAHLLQVNPVSFTKAHFAPLCRCLSLLPLSLSSLGFLDATRQIWGTATNYGSLALAVIAPNWHSRSPLCCRRAEVLPSGLRRALNM